VKTHFTAQELAALPGMPKTHKGVWDLGEKGKINRRKRSGRGGGWEYSLDSLPSETRTHLARQSASTLPAPVVDAVKTVALSAEAAEAERWAARAESVTMFQRLPEWQQRGAETKLAIIKACERFITTSGMGRTEGQEIFCYEYNLGRIDIAPAVRAQYRSVHPATIREWMREEHQMGIMGLVDYYGNRRGQGKIETSERLSTTLIALMLEKPHVKAKHAWEVLQATCPDEPKVSVKSVERFMASWKERNKQEYTLATNPDSYKNRFQAAMGDRSEGIDGPNQRWEIDATPADLMLVDGRYKIIGMCDVGTRRLDFYVTKTERAIDNTHIMRRCLLAWGVPAGGTLATDNGTYKAEAFKRVMRDLEIHQHFCRPFSGDEKPHIERGFRTFSHDLVELLPGYIGHNVTQRKDIEARKSFAQRLRDPEAVIEVKMTSADLQAFCDRWCAAYHDLLHSSIGRTPNQVVSEWRGAIHRITDERALDVLLAPIAGDNGRRIVSKKGLKINGYHYIHGDLHRYIGEEVRVLETDDIGRVVVHATNDAGLLEFVCIAECPEVTGISRAEVAAVSRARQNEHKAEMRRHAKEAKKALKGVDIATAVLASREAAAAASNVAHFPRPTITYTTPALEAAGEAARALAGPQPVIEHAPEIAASRARLEAEMAPASATVFEIPHDGAAKYRLWCQLDGLISGGVDVSEEELRFYEAFKGSRTWRAFRGVEEDIYSLRK